MTGLPPRIHPLVRSFLADQAGPAGLLDRFGSPLNVLFPEIFTANVAGFRDELDASGLRYRICYAHKANQGRTFVRAARAAGIGIDVASPGELDSALAAGFPPGLIEATGPKGRDFLGVLAGSGVTVNVDNLWELGELARLGRAGTRCRCWSGCAGSVGRTPGGRAGSACRPPVSGPSRTCWPWPGTRWTSSACRSTWTPARRATGHGPWTSACGCSSGPGRPGSARGSWTSAAASARPSPTPRSRSRSTPRRSGAAWPATVRRSPGAVPRWGSGSRTPGSAAR
jgi:Pyridoxal-dependent decarboxylase, pyridoxal binding domain